jgi:uncharacterized protein
MSENINPHKAMDIALILRYRIPALILLIILTLALGFGLTRLKLAVDPLASMYPEGHPYIKTLKAIKAMAPESRLLVCIVDLKQGDIYNEATLNKIDNVTKALMEIDIILPEGITSLTKGMMHYNNTAQGLKIESVMGAQWPQTPGEFAELKRRVAVNPMGPGRYIAYDGTAAMITAKLTDPSQVAKDAFDKLPEKGRPPFEKFVKQQGGFYNAKLVKAIEAIKAKEDDRQHTLYFMGQEVLTHQLTEMGKTHVGTAAGVMLVIIIILLAFYFKSVAGVVVPLSAMIVAMVWMLGLYGLSGLELNPLMILFPLVLGLLTVAVSILVLQAYYRYYLELKDKTAAIAATYSHMPIRGAILTAGLTVVGMCIAGVPMVRSLGFMGLFWTIGAYAAVFLLVPCLLALLPTADIPIAAESGTVKDIGALRYIMLLLGLVLLLGGGLAFPRLEVDGNVPGINYISPSHPWAQCFNLLNKKFMGPNQLLVYVRAKQPGGLVVPESINAVSDFSSYLVNECGARESIAYDYMVKMARWTMMDGNPKWLTLPMEKAQIEGLAGIVTEQGGVEDFIDKSYTQAVISPFFPNRDAGSIDNYSAKMQAYIDNNPCPTLEFRLGGGLLGMTKPQNDATRMAYPIVFIAALITVLALTSIVTLSLLKGFGITLFIAAAQALVWLVMLAVGKPVSMPVVAVTAAAIGFGAILGLALTNGIPRRGSYVMGLIVFAACLPWFFIGMRFQAVMLITFGGTVLAQMITSLLFIPALVKRRKA